jgi:hypothetical protein
LKARIEDLDKFMAQRRLHDFGNNVMLAVRPFDGGRLVQRAASPERLIALERLERVMRCTKLKREIWAKFVDSVSVKCQLESWGAQLNQLKQTE